MPNIRAVIGGAVVYSMFGGAMYASLTLPADNNVYRALILETIMTFTAIYVILTTLHNTKNKIAYAVGLLAIGFAFGFNVILGGNVSGASMNPARSFGPALIVWNFDYQWHPACIWFYTKTWTYRHLLHSDYTDELGSSGQLNRMFEPSL